VLLAARFFMHNIPYEHWYSPITDLLLVENIGLPFPMEGINYPCWYLSVLLFGGTAIYCLVRIVPKKAYIYTAVIIASSVYIYFMMHSPGIEQWSTVGRFLYLPFWRGVSDMMIGTLLYIAPKPSFKIGRLAECISSIGVALLLVTDGPYFDYLAAAMIIILVWSIRSEYSLLNTTVNTKLIRTLDEYQYGMYVNHICVVLLFRYWKVTEHFPLWLAIILLASTVYVIAVAGKRVSQICVREITKSAE